MSLLIHAEKIDASIAKELESLCPFGAISYDGKGISIGSGCKMCKMCVRKGPAGAITWEEEKVEACHKEEWRGISVFVEMKNGKIHPVSLELIGKAKELAEVIHHPVYALVIGEGIQEAANELLFYGVDKVFTYEDEKLKYFTITPYANAFTHFIQQIKPCAILVGATVMGRSLAPKVAARVHAGLTADCTMLEMKENTDLVQIRPAFGGNIMAQIVTPNTRPQFCTVRYKIFSAPERTEAIGKIIPMALSDFELRGKTEVLNVKKKPEEMDISDADIIVAVGRGIKSKEDLSLAEDFAEKLGAQLAGTRPLVEAGWLDPKKQIGLSGRTVKPKLIITLGVSGSVQFAAGMRGSEKIIAINQDPNAPIFDIAHEGYVGDLYEIIPMLLKKWKGEKQ